MAEQRLIKYGDRGFASVQEMIEYVNSLEEGDRYQVQHELLEKMLQHHEDSGDYVEEIYNWVKGSGEWRRHLGEEEFKAYWEEAEKVVESNVARRSRRAEAAKAIGVAWNGAPELLDWVKQEHRTPSWLAGARQFAKKNGIEGAIQKINAAVLDRLDNER
jgi:hypothetical protein